MKLIILREKQLSIIIKSRPELFDKIISLNVNMDINFMVTDSIDLMIDCCADGYIRYNHKMNILYLAGICNTDIFRKLLKIISPLKLDRLINTKLYLDMGITIIFLTITNFIRKNHRTKQNLF